MKSQSIFIIIASSIYTFLIIDVEVSAVQASAPYASEYCMLFDKMVIGLKPYLSTDGSSETETCQYFWHCRMTSNKVVKAFLYTCPSADPAKPYYDAEKCECVSTSSHCMGYHNWDYRYFWTRQADETLEPLESCRTFGKDEIYYVDDFVNFDDSTQFWKCKKGAQQSSSAYSTSCGDGNIWDSSVCRCVQRIDDENAYKIHQANVHPMNRYRCAKLLS